VAIRGGICLFIQINLRESPLLSLYTLISPCHSEAKRGISWGWQDFDKQPDGKKEFLIFPQYLYTISSSL